MAAEVKKFRELLYTWLSNDVASLTAQVGTRIYPVWPAEEALYPCCAYSVQRKSGDYGFPRWTGRTLLRLFSPSEDTLDELEDAVMDSINANSADMPGKLSDAGTVQTVMFGADGIEVDDDPREAFQADNFLVITRRISIPTVFVKRQGGWSA